MVNQQLQILGKRAFYIARKSALLRRAVAMPGIAGVVNRICDRILQPAPDYPQWIARRLIARREIYRCSGEPGLLSFLTTVWNTPLRLLEPAVESLLRKQTLAEFQWVVVDNGSTDPDVVAYLRQTVAGDPRVVFLRVEENLGIVGGMHLALSRATGQYVLPFDSDDLLYPDAVAILTHQLRASHYPPAMYSDEDKRDGNTLCWPYFKPDWDPVLFLNSCFIAHLGCINRSLALELGMYTDRGCDGCHDWDSFTRLMLAGHVPVHIPEMLYTWRKHGNSTAGNIRSKNYIYQSQQHLLEQYLARIGRQADFDIVLSPLFQGTPDWWLRRKPADGLPVRTLILTESDNPEHLHAGSDVRLFLPRLNAFAGFIFITYDTLKLETEDWGSEVAGLFERFPDTVMIGGRVLDSRGRVVDAGRVPGFAGLFGCPDIGRDRADPGNLAELWKQRSVSGVSTRLCVMRTDFLQQVIVAFANRTLSWRFLGAWAALLAWRQRQRIVYTPFVSGVCDGDPDLLIRDEEKSVFKGEAGAFLADRRFYSRNFGTAAGQAYRPA